MIAQNWSDVKFYFSGDSYFQSIIDRIRTAKNEVRIEIYMFNFDALGKKILSALSEARQRGVSVYLLVDGIGSLRYLADLMDYCETHRLNFKIYHPLPIPPRFLSRFKFKNINWKNIRLFFIMFRKMNNRDHRKVFLIDQKTAFLGSYNVSKVHSEQIVHHAAWRDTGVEVVGDSLAQFIANYDIAWEKSKDPNGFFYSWSLPQRKKLFYIKEFLYSLNEAKNRIWLTTAYFLPSRKALKALMRAAERGIDVRLCLPAISDIPFMKWTSWLMYDRLLKAGVKIFEYQNRNLHAKTMIIDSYVTVGSYNLNHRSLIHDLEVQVKLQRKDWLATMCEQWDKDIAQSKQVKLGDKGHTGIFFRLLAIIFYRFRYWL